MPVKIKIKVLQRPAAVKYFLPNAKAGLMQSAKNGDGQILEEWLF